MNKNDEIIKFVDENVIGKSDTTKDLDKNLKVVRSYLELKGPINKEITKYFALVSECSEEIISLRKKGVNISTECFYQTIQKQAKEEKQEKDECVNPPSYGYHYRSSC